MATTHIYLNKSTFTQNETAGTGYPFAALLVTDDATMTVADINGAAAFNTVHAELLGGSAGDEDLTAWQMTFTAGAPFQDSGLQVFPLTLAVANWDANGTLGGAAAAAYLETYANPPVGGLVTITAKGTAIHPDAPIRFAKLADAYMIDSDPAANNPSWLSADTRVFLVKQGQSTARGAAVPFTDVNGNAIVMGSAAPDNTTPQKFLANVLAGLNGMATDAAAAQIFNGLSADENGSRLSFAQKDINGTAIYNFALARVRLDPNQPNRTIQAFFRVFRTLNANLQYDALNNPPENYRRVSTNSAVPAFGRIASGANLGSIVDIPFYATARQADQTMQPADNQVALPLQGAQAARTTYYFGVVIDINPDPTDATVPKFPDPMLPINQDDNFSAAPMSTVGGLLQQSHCCMVVEVNDPDNPVESPGNVTAFENPQNSELLSQRNLGFETATNFGEGHDTRSVQHNFEFVPFVPGKAARVAHPALHYDELLFLSHKLPADTKVELYMPGVDLALAAERVKHVHVRDKHRIEFTLHQAKRIPIPVARGSRAPALMTVHLPPAHDVGEVYVVDVLQLDPATGTVVGAFQVRTPIVKSRVALEDAFEREEEQRREKSTPKGWEAIQAEQKTFARAKLHAVAREVVKDYGADAAREVRVVLDKVQVPIARKEPMPLVARVFDGGALVATVRVVIPAGAPGVVPVGTVVYQGLGLEHLGLKLGTLSAGAFVALHTTAVDVRGDASTTGDPTSPETWHVWYHVQRGKNLAR